jgi:hypothetical protein
VRVRIRQISIKNKEKGIKKQKMRVKVDEKRSEKRKMRVSSRRSLNNFEKESLQGGKFLEKQS